MDTFPRLTAAGALLALASTAHAFSGVRSEYDAQLSLVRAQAVSPSGVSVSANGTGVRISGPATFPGPAGQRITGTLAANITGRGVARIALRAVPVIGTGLLLADILEAVRVKEDDGDLLLDAGQDQITATEVRFRVTNGAEQHTDFRHATIAQACEYVLAQSGSPGVNYAKRVITFNTGPLVGSCRMDYAPPGGAWATWYTRSVVGQETSFLRCPVPRPGTVNDYPTVGHDGKCPTFTWLEPMTPEEAANRLFEPGTNPIPAAQWKAIMDDVMNRSPDPVRIDGESTQEVTELAPATVPGPTKTTTDATGTTTETVGFYGIPSDAAEAAKVEWTKRTTTTKTDPEGNPVGTPTVVDEGPAPSEDAEPTVDQCESNPGRLGCIEAGEVPDSELETAERSVEFDRDSGWGPDTAACPAPSTFTAMGQTLSIDHTPICDALGVLRFIVIAAAALAGAYIVMGAFRQ